MSKEINDYCEKVVEKYKIPGFAIGLAKDGELSWEKGFGHRDVENNLPVTPDTVFGIGSVTKSFTCVAIMQLQEMGKLSVHDQVIKYIPEFKTPDQKQTDQITIHHLMTHSAGLPPMPTLYAALKESMDNDPKPEGTDDQKEQEDAKSELTPINTYDEFLTYIAELEYELIGLPGKEFSYSNDAYSLLGIIIDRVSGQSYEDFIKEHILEPTGMKNSVFHLEELNDHDEVAILYNSRKENDETIVFESNNPWDAPSMRAAGFLKSTVNDMLKYAEIFRNSGTVEGQQILSPESVEQMTAPYIECGPGQYYGYGLMITPDFYGHKLVEHGGAVKGVAAQMNIIPELGITGVSLANLAGVPSTKLLFSAFADALGQPVTASHIHFEEVEVEQEALQEYEGEFKSGEGASVKFQMKEGKLLLSTDELSEELQPVGNDSFALSFREDKMAIRFIRNDEGAITRVSFGFRQIPKVLGEKANDGQEEE